MSAPVCVGLDVELPDSFAELQDPRAEVRDAVQDLVSRWGVEFRPDPEIRGGAGALSLTINGHETPKGLAEHMVSRVAQTADTVALTSERPSPGWMLRTWVKLMLSVTPQFVLTDELCNDTWKRRNPDPAGAPMPIWFPQFMWRLSSLGVPVPDPEVLRLLLERAPEADPLQLTEVVLDMELRSVQVVASGHTFDDLARSVHSGHSHLEHQLVRALGTLGILTPAVTLARDGSVASSTCEIRLGSLTLAVSAVPPADTLLAMVSPDLLSREGVIAPISPGAGWTLVRKNSPAEVEAIQQFECDEADYLVHSLVDALALLPERLPDRRAAERLLADLSDHVGSGHTVWFADQAISIQQVAIVLRRMLAVDLPLTDLPALLRELLAVIDVIRPSQADFIESLDRALSRRTP